MFPLKILLPCWKLHMSMDFIKSNILYSQFFFSFFKFIENRLSACGAHAPLFTKNALTLIHQASGGILRAIGNIANAALLKAFVAKSTQVEAEHVQAVVQR